MKLIKDEQERIFLDESSAVDFFQQQEARDIWKTCFTQELTAFPIPGLQSILHSADSVRQEYALNDDISDESIEETISGTKLGLQLPLVKMESYPISQTAFTTLMQRAGYAASPVILSQKEKNNQREMSPADKANVLNIGLNCYGNKSLVLIRDEKVRAVLSGDESDYSRLPVTDLYEKMRSVLDDIYPNWSFETASASHLYSTILVSLNDTNLENEILQIFQKAGLRVKGKPMVRLITSDVGLSGANLYPILKERTGSEFGLGIPLSLTHNNRHNAEDFRKNVQQITAMFRESKEKLTDMMTAPINHPGGCLRAIAKKCLLPKKLVCNMAADFEAMYKKCYEIDVYYALFDILATYETENDISATRTLALQESIARVAFSKMSDYDYEFNWE